MNNNIIISSALALLIFIIPSSINSLPINQSNVPLTGDPEAKQSQTSEGQLTENLSGVSETSSQNDVQSEEIKGQKNPPQSGAANASKQEKSSKSSDVTRQNNDQNGSANTSAVATTGMLTVKKVVINNNGQTQVPNQFILIVDGNIISIDKQTPNEERSFRGAEFGTEIRLTPGSYSIREADNPNYDKTFSSECSGNINAGEEKTCVVQNDDIALPQGTLIVQKRVINNNGLAKRPSDFTLSIDGDVFSINGGNPNAQKSFPGSESGTTIVLREGKYGLKEGSDPDYTTTRTDSCGGPIRAGETKTCIITNDDKPLGTLTIVKNLINDNFGMAREDRFEFNVVSLGDPQLFEVRDGSTTSRQLVLSVTQSDPYIISIKQETEAGSEYSFGYSPDCRGTISRGQSKTCNIIINDKAPTGSAKIIFDKQVINDDGGTKQPSYFGLGICLDHYPFFVQLIPCTPGTSGAHLIATLRGPSGSIDIPSGLPVYFTEFQVGNNSPVTGYHTSSRNLCTEQRDPNSGGLVPQASSINNCSIVNNDDEPAVGTLRLLININNDNGGTKVASDFTFSLRGGNPINFQGQSVLNLQVFAPPGSFTNYLLGIGSLSEPYKITAKGYKVDAFVCQSDRGTFLPQDGEIGIKVFAREVTECSLTLDDIAALLKVNKVVINNDRGQKRPEEFVIHISGGHTTQDFAPGSSYSAPRTFHPNLGGSSPTQTSIDGGPFSVTEDQDARYLQSFSDDCSGTIEVGEIKNCVITNDDKSPARLNVIKHVINDNGGTKSASNFEITVKNFPSSGPEGIVVPPQHFTGVESPGQGVFLIPGRYSVTERLSPEYSSSFSSECSGVIDFDQTKACTITNNDIASQVLVIKRVINDAGGTKRPQDFTMHAAGNNPSPTQFPGSESPGTKVTLSPGSYSIDEDSVRFYTKYRSPECFGTISVSQTKTCTITNDDQVLPTPGTLIVKKVVNNDDGGTKKPSDFTIRVNAPDPGASPSSFQGSDSGTSVSVVPGQYTVTEDLSSEYTSSFSTECSGNITSGQTKTCTITNNDKQAILLVKKHVINDNQGGALASQFTIKIRPISSEALTQTVVGSEQGAKVVLVPGFTYNIREVGEDTDGRVTVGTHPYDVSYSPDCTNVSVNNGKAKVCTVTNNDAIE